MTSNNPETEPEGTEQSENQKPVNILLVEDNPNDIELTRKAFEKGRLYNNFHVVNDGIEAMSFLRKEGEYENKPRPDIILLDLEMPRMDGKEVLEELKNDADFSTIPVIVLTSSEAEQDIIESYEYDANAYLTKPVGYKEFNEIIRQIEEFWFQVVKLPRTHE